MNFDWTTLLIQGMTFDFSMVTAALAAIAVVINLFAATGIWRIVRFVNLQKDFPPHRHFKNDILYPKDYAPEKAQSMAAGGMQ